MSEQTASMGMSFFALSDDRRVRVRLGDNGQAELMRHNLLSLPQEVLGYLKTQAQEFWYPRPVPDHSTDPAWIINQCTDPDSYAKGLDWLDDRFGGRVPIFNSPAAVRKSARDAQALQMAGIDNLIVPKSVRFTFETADDLDRVFRENGFDYPVLVRPNELQTGQGLVRIDSAAGWDALLYTPWFRKTHIMTQFVDSRTSEGVYFKARVMLIGGKPFLRHVKASVNWLVHNERQTPVTGFPERELDMVDALEADDTFMAICSEIGNRCGLDFCGADIGFDLDQKKYVLFEANPSMSVFFPGREGKTDFEKRRSLRLHDEPGEYLAALIRDPSRWIDQAKAG